MSETATAERYGSSRLKTARERSIYDGTADGVLPGKRQKWLDLWLAQGLITQADYDDPPPLSPQPIAIAAPPPRKSHKAPLRSSPMLACIHRGPALVALDVPGCTSPPMTYACPLKGRCVLMRDGGNRRKAIEASGLTICRECSDRQPPGESKPVGAAPRRLRRSPPITVKSKSAVRSIAKPVGRSPFAYRPGKMPEFVTTSRLMEDVKKLASMLPADTSRIVGVARSGLCVATMVAMLRHLPLDIARQSKGDLIDGGNGWRLTGNVGYDRGPVVVIDDTVMTGNSFKHVMPVIQKTYPNAIAAAVYVNPSARLKPQIWARDLPWPHLLEWNLFNSIMSPHCAVDFDGILCHDCAPQDDDDGPRYAKFLADVRPLYVVRRVKIPLIVTARLEKYRPQTVAWLNRHGIGVQELVMWPGANHRQRSLERVAQYKAEHYRKFLGQRHRIQPPMFVESCPHQAQRIAQISGGLVVCPAAGRCFP